MSKWLFGTGGFIFSLGWIAAFLNPILKDKSSFQCPIRLISALIIGGFVLIVAGAFVKIYVENKGKD